MPHAFAQVAQVQVGRVLPPGEPLRREQRPQVAAPAVEQRADQCRGAQRPPRPHPTRPTAAQQAQQHRLRLVIRGVRDRYGGGSPRGRAGSATESAPPETPTTTPSPGRRRRWRRIVSSTVSRRKIEEPPSRPVWWRRGDSNSRLRGDEPRGLTHLSTPPRASLYSLAHRAATTAARERE